MATAALCQDMQDFWMPSTIARLPHAPDWETFYRNYVVPNVPVIIQNVVSAWPATTRWPNPHYWHRPDVPVSVDFTPNGLADTLLHESHWPSWIFVQPEKRILPLSEIWSAMHNTDTEIAYVSHQNDNLRQEMAFLRDDVPAAVDWAARAFGNAPEAVNVWMGGSASISSLHQDFYENLYGVVTGQKIFDLYPPAAIAFLEEKTVPTGFYVRDVQAGWQMQQYPSWSVRVDPTLPYTTWIATDVMGTEELPLQPLHVVVDAGELLYLPAMYYHRVAQTKTPTIAVNYWHDMAFDCKYVYAKAMARIPKSPVPNAQ